MNLIKSKILIKMFAAVAAVMLISFLPVDALSESNNMALAQYYAALAAMGGDENTTVEQAQALAYQYAMLAQQESLQGLGPVADNTQMGVVQQGLIKVTNKNASQEFYNQQVALINGMSPALQQQLALYGAEYITTATGADFGQSQASGMCQATQSRRGKKRSLKLVIYLAESPVNPNGAHTIYHETAHALDSIAWQKTGTEASATRDFLNADAGETDAMYSLYIGNNMIDSPSEHYADAVAAFYIKNGQLAANCPKLYQYCLTHCPY
ncbi:MAG: hypothetical protein K5870_00075 [Lachnospiraceae bacterium]|nr:hypothetical protein [Lachnospiraceae bacterium]